MTHYSMFFKFADNDFTTLSYTFKEQRRDKTISNQIFFNFHKNFLSNM
ncbi:protein of unknown function [Candidatus Nitrosocosmicus franklandus]|uniref:Uncharacterized protein n=1 Tax=Candidatus Nitrosocosmicus franklandianus TaxID=1798806 RepID=A0A484IB41_9ARCH|nr:protein of unknown function [Candidatus Nitrosocosmicus franklandus]